VERVTVARYSPFSGGFSRNPAAVEGHTAADGEVIESVLVGADYAETLGIPLRLGRTLGDADLAGTRRAGMVNDAFVRRYFPDQNPLGRHFGTSSRMLDTEIVGVIGDVPFHDLRTPVEPMVFVPERPDYGEFTLDAELTIRVAREAAPGLDDLRRAIRQAAPELPMEAPARLAAQIGQSLEVARLTAWLVAAFGGVALLLACVGIYGMTNQGVVRRTREIGIRIALGASRAEVIAVILRDMLRPLAIGLAAGLVLSLGAARLMSSLLFGVSAADPWSIGAAMFALTSVAALAGFIPARRAARVDPMTALRAE
jgi:predicted permease